MIKKCWDASWKITMSNRSSGSSTALHNAPITKAVAPLECTLGADQDEGRLHLYKHMRPPYAHALHHRGAGLFCCIPPCETPRLHLRLAVGDRKRDRLVKLLNQKTSPKIRVDLGAQRRWTFASIRPGPSPRQQQQWQWQRQRRIDQSGTGRTS